MIKFNIAPGFASNALYENAYAKIVNITPGPTTTTFVVHGFRNSDDAAQRNRVWFQKVYTVPTPESQTPMPRIGPDFIAKLYESLLAQPFYVDAVLVSNP